MLKTKWFRALPRRFWALPVEVARKAMVAIHVLAFVALHHEEAEFYAFIGGCV